MPQEKWALVIQLSTFLPRLPQAIGITAVTPPLSIIAPYSSANSIFAINEVMGFMVEACRPEVGLAPSLLRPHTGRIGGHKKQKARCW
jgi:hypothetical protein